MSIDRDTAKHILSDKQFAVWDLRNRGAFSYQQIADALDLSVSGVRSHIKAYEHRIRQHQRKEAA